MTWDKLLDSFKIMWDSTIPFVLRVVDMFNTPMRDIGTLGPIDWVIDFLTLILPISVLDLTLLQFMTGSFIASLLVIYIVKAFRR